jgi:hypothetical protein
MGYGWVDEVHFWGIRNNRQVLFYINGRNIAYLQLPNDIVELTYLLELLRSPDIFIIWNDTSYSVSSITGKVVK